MRPGKNINYRIIAFSLAGVLSSSGQVVAQTASVEQEALRMRALEFVNTSEKAQPEGQPHSEHEAKIAQQEAARKAQEEARAKAAEKERAEREAKIVQQEAVRKAQEEARARAAERERAKTRQIIVETEKKRTTSARSGTSSKPEELIAFLVRDFNNAIAREDFVEADALLKTMSQHLPEKSLTLLRMRAWYALMAEQENAIFLYRQLLDRIGNDENAAINLAILEARAGHIEEARRIVNELAAQVKDSERLDAIRQSFGIDIN